MTVTLLQGDCLELMKQLPDKSIDLVVCDLPYGVTIAKWDKALDMTALWKEYNRVCKGAIVLTSSGLFTFSLYSSNPKGFRYRLIWKKTRATGFLAAKKRPLRVYEDILVFGNKKAVYNPQKTTGHKPYSTKHSAATSLYGSQSGAGSVISTSTGERFPTDVVEIASVSKKLHATEKPVALMEWLIKTYSNPGDTVLDNCMGSGTTGVACVNTDRNFIGMEIDEGFFTTAKERINGKV